MTKEEREKIYREVLFEYRKQDAEWHTREYLEDMEIDISLEKFDFGGMADQFELQMDANIAENVTWERIVEEWVADIRWLEEDELG